MQYFGVSFWFSKDLKGFILVFLLSVLWFLHLCKLLLAVFYPTVYVHTLEHCAFIKSDANIKRDFKKWRREKGAYGIMR